MSYNETIINLALLLYEASDNDQYLKCSLLIRTRSLDSLLVRQGLWVSEVSRLSDSILKYLLLVPGDGLALFISLHYSKVLLR